MATDCIGEDAELVVRLHRTLAESHTEAGVVFVPEPVAWTEVPSTRRVLRLQRRRWHRGLAEILVRHRRMLLRPRYGVIGMITMPWFLLFELLSPVVEVLGLAFFFLLLVFLGVEQWIDTDVDLVNPPVLLMMITASVLFSVFVTLVALLAEEISFRRYRGLPDLFRAIYAAVEENVGYRQLNAWWRLGGIFEVLRDAPTTGVTCSAPDSTRRERWPAGRPGALTGDRTNFGADARDGRRRDAGSLGHQPVGPVPQRGAPAGGVGQPGHPGRPRRSCGPRPGSGSSEVALAARADYEEAQELLTADLQTVADLTTDDPELERLLVQQERAARTWVDDYGNVVISRPGGSGNFDRGLFLTGVSLFDDFRDAHDDTTAAFESRVSEANEDSALRLTTTVLAVVVLALLEALVIVRARRRLTGEIAEPLHDLEVVVHQMAQDPTSAPSARGRARYERSPGRSTSWPTPRTGRGRWRTGSRRSCGPSTSPRTTSSRTSRTSCGRRSPRSAATSSWWPTSSRNRWLPTTCGCWRPGGATSPGSSSWSTTC